MRPGDSACTGRSQECADPRWLSSPAAWPRLCRTLQALALERSGRTDEANESVLSWCGIEGHWHWVLVLRRGSLVEWGWQEGVLSSLWS